MRSTASVWLASKRFVSTLRKTRTLQCYAAWQIVAAALLVSTTSRPASAFPIESAATEPCHENITMEAWRQVRAALPVQAAELPSRGDDEALIKDVPFTVPKSLQSIGPVTLLLGVRDNDIKEHGPMELKSLTPQASNPDVQMEHCLRAPEHDEPNGTEQAVEACRAFIRDRLLTALDGLGENRIPDTAQREDLEVSLAIRDQIDVEVPLFFLNAGRALHALQDSFTHTFRTPDDPNNPANPDKITVMLNFVDYTNGTLDEAVDGPPHASELDVCDNPDELRTQRRAHATEASAVALMALLDPEKDPVTEIDRMLDTYVAFDATSDCTPENGWCDAAERKYGSPTLRCSFSGAAPRSSLLMSLPFVAMALLLRLRRRGGAAKLAGVAAFVLASASGVGVARADDTSGPIDGPASALSGQSDSATVGKIDRAGAFFGRVAIGASYDNAALSGGLGTRYQFSRKWMLGLDAEWNPYIATSPGRLRTGSGNAYLSLIRRFQLRYESVNIRTTASLGASMLLFDLVGADKYSVGPFFGVSFLGVEWKVARGVYVTLDPTYIAIPVPSLKGVPFMYAQYRFLLGLEFGG
jgi:hypothetical protein